jgi:hypothetical protein
LGTSAFRVKAHTDARRRRSIVSVGRALVLDINKPPHTHARRRRRRRRRFNVGRAVNVGRVLVLNDPPAS